MIDVKFKPSFLAERCPLQPGFNSLRNYYSMILECRFQMEKYVEDFIKDLERFISFESEYMIEEIHRIAERHQVDSEFAEDEFQKRFKVNFRT